MINWNRRSYTQEEFIKAWNSSTSIAQVADKIGCNRSGGGYATIKSAAQELQLSDEHMQGQAWNTGLKFKPNKPKPIEEILVEYSTYSTYNLKLRLWNEGIFPRKCNRCGIEEWMGQPAPLALEHKNGIKTDHRLENLEILCYNCHGLTDTFGGKNKKKRSDEVG